MPSRPLCSRRLGAVEIGDPAVVDRRDVFVSHTLPDARKREDGRHVGWQTRDAFVIASCPDRRGGRTNERHHDQHVERATLHVPDCLLDIRDRALLGAGSSAATKPDYTGPVTGLAPRRMTPIASVFPAIC